MQFRLAPLIPPATARSNWDCAVGCANRPVWNLGYVEQLYTFGDRNRDPSEGAGGPRVISVAYLALVREGKLSGTAGADWRDWYLFFPWEDWRAGKPAVIEKHIAPALDQWTKAAPNRRVRQERRERSDINFGLGGAPWVPERVLERYELLYEIELAVEALRDRDKKSAAGKPAIASLLGAADGTRDGAGSSTDAGDCARTPSRQA